MQTVNLIDVRKLYLQLLNLRRQAALARLETRERLEAESDDKFIDASHQSIQFSDGVYEILDDTVRDLRRLLIEEYPTMDRKTLFSG